MQPVMISCQQRHAERQETLASLPVTLHPIIILNPCQPATGLENRKASYAALTKAHQRNTSALFMEDDITANPDLHDALALAQTLDTLTSFCIIRRTDYPQEIQDAIRTRKRITPGLYPIRNPQKWHGTQCVYIPRHIVNYCITHPLFLKENHGLDFFLRQHVPGPFYTYAPNPIQHRSPPTMRYQTGTLQTDRRKRHSETFHPQGATAYNQNKK